MSSHHDDSLVDQTIDGRYVVSGFLAKGGMATVYTAMDTRLDREVALKVMRADLADDEAFVARFRREARAAARLSHPNVVGVFDQGRDGRRVFLAMELVRGRTLRELIRREAPLTARGALDILDPVLQALGAAHRADTVHRDVKPENVLIGDDGAVKVADFGLARAITTETLTTNHDVLLGTAAYLSPEQVEHGRGDKRSDVYSATLLLHEMLTGVKAFSGDSPIHVAYQHVHGGVPQPSAVLPGIAGELDQLVALGAAKQPGQRPDDATAMLQQVRATRAQLSEAELDRVLVRGGTPGSGPGDGRTQAIAGRSMTQPNAVPDRARATPRPSANGPVVAHPGAAEFRRPGRRTAVLGVAGAAILAVGGAGWWFGLGPGSRITVPKVEGRPQGEAVALLDDAGLSAQVREIFSETVPKGAVVSSSPRSGEDHRRYDPVALTVSRGPERLAVPEVAGASEKEATARIRAARLTRGKITREFSETVAKGKVISSDPSRGDELKPGSKVALVVSKGREPIDVPDVRRKPASVAESTLQGLGLKVEKAPEQHHNSVPKGEVITQDPSGGTLFRNDVVTLTVSKGPEMVTVPNVVDNKTAKARKTLEDAGLSVDVTRFLGGAFDTVRGQTPSAGTKVRKGSTVKITVV